MSYQSQGLIQASDYNNFVGTSPSSTANRINTIWAVGNGNRGYGQTPLNQVSASGLVTATQWATAINTLNTIYIHQTNSGTGITTPTTGGLITYLSNFSSSITTAYTNALNKYSTGTQVVGTTWYTTASTSNTAYQSVANQQAAATFTIVRTVTFPSGDAARYFFNAGGSINFALGTATNPGGTSRGADLVTLLNTNYYGTNGFAAVTNGQRNGSSGTVTSGASFNYTGGYYGLTTSPQTIIQVTSTTSAYTSDYVQLQVQSNGAQGANADVGTVLTFTLTIYSASRPTLPAPPANPPGTGTTTTNTVSDDSIQILTPHSINITPPESTNLTNSWGTIGSTIVVA
jgi:hypothetical protein